MARLSLNSVMAYAAGVGFTGDSLVTAVAIAGWAGSPSPGESGGDPGAIGDVALSTGKWGPSIGLWQIRSLHADRGSGRERDELALYDPGFNARSAWTISSGGTNFNPWTVYKNGTYRNNVASVRAAISTNSVQPPTIVVDAVGQPNGSTKIEETYANFRGIERAPSGSDIPGLDEIIGFGSATASFIGHLLDPGFWIKVGWVALGILLIGVGSAVLVTGSVDGTKVVRRRG